MKAPLLILPIYLGAVCGYLPFPRISSIGAAGDSAITNTLADTEQKNNNQVQLGISKSFDAGTGFLTHLGTGCSSGNDQEAIDHVQLGITNDYDSGTDLLAHIDEDSNLVQIGISKDLDAGTDLLAHLGVSGGDGHGGDQQFGLHGAGGLATDFNFKLDGSQMSYGRGGPFKGFQNPFGGRRGPFKILNADNNNGRYVQDLGRRDIRNTIGESLLGDSLGIGGMSGSSGDGGLSKDLGLKLYRAQQSLGNLDTAARSSLGETKNLLGTLEVANDYVKQALASGVGHHQDGFSETSLTGHEFQTQEGINDMGSLVSDGGLADALKLKLYRAEQSLGDLSRAAQMTFGYTEDLLETIQTDINYSKHLKNVWDTIVEIERLKVQTGLDLLNYKVQEIDDLVGLVGAGGLSDGLKQKLNRVEQSLGDLSRAAQASVGYTEGLLQTLGTDKSYAKPALSLEIENTQGEMGKSDVSLADVGFQNYMGFDKVVDLQSTGGLSTDLDLKLDGPQQSYIDLSKAVQTTGGIEDSLGVFKTDNNHARYSINL